MFYPNFLFIYTNLTC